MIDMSEEIGLRGELIKLLDSDPFVPFQIVMSSGDRYEVSDPHSVAVARDVVIVVPPRGVSSKLRWNHINALDVKDDIGGT
jgi:hypothetical protein